MISNILIKKKKKKEHASLVEAVGNETNPKKKETLLKRCFKLRDKIYGKRCN